MTRSYDDYYAEHLASFLADGESAEDAAQMADEWATRDVAEDAAEATAAEADDATYASWEASEAAVAALAREVEAALTARGWRADPLGWEKSRSSHSRYQRFARDGEELAVRVSDHRQVAGGGYDCESQQRTGEADVDFVVGDDVGASIASVG